MSGENNFEISIITPERTFFKGMIEQIIVNTIDGSLGILKDFSPQIIALVSGEFNILKEGEWLKAVNGSGFIQVKDKKVLVLCEKAEWPHEIKAETACVAVKKDVDLTKQNKSYNEYLLSKAHLQELLRE